MPHFSAYELMSEEQQKANHMQFGLALSLETVANVENNEIFFKAIAQVNKGGPESVYDTSHKGIIARLNLQAGKLSIVLSDYTTALSLFEHGISYLGSDCWTAEYELSIELYDTAAEAACVLNENAAVTSYTKQLVDHARSFDDSLNCECLCCMWYVFI